MCTKKYQKGSFMPRVNDEYIEKKRNEIIDAAYRVCVRKPITSVEMKDVIAETGFSHGAIYRYYKDLDEVLHDLIKKINSENRIDDRLKMILDHAGTKEWKRAIHEICDLLADQMESVGTDLLKLSIYSDMLAMSDPKRAVNIAEKLGNDEQSPLLYLFSTMTEYLSSVVEERSLKPSKTIDEILQFITASYHGIQTGYVLSDCFKVEQVQGRYKPKEMFSCLAESVIVMLDGRDS